MPPSVASPEASRSAREWWLNAFGPWYRTVYGHRDEDEAARNAPGIVRLLALPPHARVLDLGCGEGRYARALASLGCRVTGVDVSATLLEEARRRSPMTPGAPTYVSCDMRDLPFEQQYEGVVSLFTSFGYFEDRVDDARVVEGVARALVVGGRFLIDLINPAEVRSNLVPENSVDRGAYRVRMRRAIDDATVGGPYVRKHVDVVDLRTGATAFRSEERVRLYETDELDAMLRAAGLEPVGEPAGDFQGGAFSAASPRRVRVASRRTRRLAR